ncbi:uncharacterized protein LOC111898838 [Lactuca sativa]|uniref:uncharacterized protein LOC111898838 n=1 Tax=Lactuca sativa TaxID=4236 RepID=UPI000CD9B472|nr:uncharacterized protein LOC111898838 [Lactuca sativa]
MQCWIQNLQYHKEKLFTACMAMNRFHHGLQITYHDFLHINLQKRRVKAFLFVLFVVSIPWLGSRVRKNFILHNQGDDIEFGNDNSSELEIFELTIQNLTSEGLVRMQDRGLIVNNNDTNEKLVDCDSSHIVHGNKTDMMSYSDLEIKQSSIENKYDFAFMHEGEEELIDKFLKVDGIMVVFKMDNHKAKASESFQKPSNYEIIYHRQFPVAIIAMKKIRLIHDKNGASNTIPHRRLMFAQKKAEALKNLENVLLEPPRTVSGKSNMYSKKTRYLPDLMHDSLEDYPRRVFIDINGDGGWFTKNYPTRNMNFEIYQIETTVPEITDTDTNTDDEAMGELVEIEITDWLRENVRNDEYVVMKAEADVVEQLVNNKAIELVDELFLECKYNCVKCKKCKRPYWKCLALYGLLKDVGVAVHQWWG